MSFKFEVPPENCDQATSGPPDALKKGKGRAKGSRGHSVGEKSFGFSPPRNSETSMVEERFRVLNAKHVLYRTTKVQVAHKNIEQTFSERRVSWMNVCKIILTICFAIPMSMYHWRYEAWALYFVFTLLGLYAWDYIAHIRHLMRSKAQLKENVLEDCPYESIYMTSRPDKVDIVAPYLIFICLSMLVIAFVEASAIYSRDHADSGLIKILKQSDSVAEDSLSKVTRGTMKFMNN